MLSSPSTRSQSTREVTLLLCNHPQKLDDSDSDVLGRAHWPGYLLAFLSTLFFAASATCNKIATTSHHMSSETVAFIFSLVASGLSLICIVLDPGARDSFSKLSTFHFVIILIRGLIGTCNVLLLYKSLELIPIGQADAAYFVTPSFTLILAGIILGEQVQVPDAFLAFGSIIGVVMISLPAIFVIQSSNSPLMQHVENFRKEHIMGVLSALFAAFLNASGMVITRRFAHHVHFLFFVLALGVCGLVLTTLIGHAVNPIQAFHHYPNVLLAAITVGLCASSAQILVHWALNISPASHVALVRNCEVPLVYFLAIIFLSETPALVPLLGSTVVVGSAIAIGLRQIR